MSDPLLDPLENQAIEIAMDAMELGSAERQDFVREACQREVGDTGQSSVLQQLVHEYIAIQGNELFASSDLEILNPNELFRFLAAQEKAHDDANASRQASDHVDLQARTVDGYTIRRPLGEGGFSQVFAAYHAELDRLVAIKFSSSSIPDPRSEERFHRERKLLAQIKHGNIVQAYDAGRYEGRNYLVMELVKGSNLQEFVEASGPLDYQYACEIVRQICCGVQFLWEEFRIIHRDLKPSNVFLSDGGQVKIGDFGLSKSKTDEVNLTRGLAVGTWDYLAPEQWTDASDPDIRSDIYAIGCTLIFLLTGKPPFAHREGPAKALAHHYEPPWIPEELRDELRVICGKCLAKNPDGRYQEPAELAEALLPLIGEIPLPEAISSGIASKTTLANVKGPGDETKGVVDLLADQLAQVRKPRPLHPALIPVLCVTILVFGTLMYMAFFQRGNGEMVEPDPSHSPLAPRTEKLDLLFRMDLQTGLVVDEETGQLSPVPEWKNRKGFLDFVELMLSPLPENQRDLEKSERVQNCVSLLDKTGLDHPQYRNRAWYIAGSILLENIETARAEEYFSRITNDDKLSATLGWTEALASQGKWQEVARKLPAIEDIQLALKSDRLSSFQRLEYWRACNLWCQYYFVALHQADKAIELAELAREALNSTKGSLPTSSWHHKNGLSCMNYARLLEDTDREFDEVIALYDEAVDSATHAAKVIDAEYALISVINALVNRGIYFRKKNNMLVEAVNDFELANQYIERTKSEKAALLRFNTLTQLAFANHLMNRRLATPDPALTEEGLKQLERVFKEASRSNEDQARAYMIDAYYKAAEIAFYGKIPDATGRALQYVDQVAQLSPRNHNEGGRIVRTLIMGFDIASRRNRADLAVDYLKRAKEMLDDGDAGDGDWAQSLRNLVHARSR